MSTDQNNDLQTFLAATSQIMDQTQQTNFLFALKRGLPDLKQQLDNAKKK